MEDVPEPSLSALKALGKGWRQSSLPFKSWQIKPNAPKYLTKCLPSAAGVDAAGLPFERLKSSKAIGLIPLDHRRLPLVRSWQRVSSSPLRNVVRKIRSPYTQGEEGDQGTSTLDRTPSSGPNFTGGVASVFSPPPFTPRNCGQLARVVSAAASATALAKNTAFRWASGMDGFDVASQLANIGRTPSKNNQFIPTNSGAARKVSANTRPAFRLGRHRHRRVTNSGTMCNSA